jgi:UDP-N-acetylmuramate: L-alanyl-gamma-D-glutamyl-meso-diaminopimelate ligase
MTIKNKKKRIKKKKAHIIGICGAGMSALAVLLKEVGFEISGSDNGFYEPILGYLKRNKIKFYEKYSAKNIPNDVSLIVIGKHAGLSAEENPEAKRAYESGVEVKSLPEALAMLSARTKNIVVAGSYGKSTLSALLSWCLLVAGKDPSYFIAALPARPTGVGGPIDLKNSSHIGKGRQFVLEGDEYPSSNTDKKSKFLHLSPESVLLISAEHDHVNIFPTEKSYLEPYKKLAAKIPKSGLLVYAKNGKNTEKVASYAVCKKISYALSDKRATWHTNNIKFGEKTSFNLMRKVDNKSKKIIALETSLMGAHNIENIIGAGALLLQNKTIKPADFARAVRGFHGLRRRLELKNKNSAVAVFEDFGSSYQKARAGFQALRLHFPGRRIIAVFEPHSFSWRNRKFLKWYETVFLEVDEVVLLPASESGKKAPGQLGSEEIWNKAKKYASVRTARSEKEALNILKKITRRDDIIVLVSSGSLLGLTKSVPKLIEKMFPK